MKKLFFSFLLMQCALFGTAQDLNFPSGKDKHDGKPVKFRGIQQNQRFSADNSGLHQMMGFSVKQKVTIPVAPGYVFKGIVTERRNETPDLFTVVMRSTEDPSLMLSMSRVMISGKPVFRGIIVSKNNSDMIMLEPDEAGNHNWNVVKVSSIIAD